MLLNNDRNQHHCSLAETKEASWMSDEIQTNKINFWDKTVIFKKV